MNDRQTNHSSADKPKILIVDDEIFNLRLLKLKFEKAGYRVILAENGEEGLGKFNAEYPDIIISDVKMPVMDGREMCERLPKTGEFLLIIVTSRIEEKSRPWIQELPNRVFMEKPISPRALLEKANQYLEQRLTSQKQLGHLTLGDTSPSEDGGKKSVSQDSIAEELANRYDELNLIYQLGSRLRLSQRIDQTFEELLKETLKTLHADGGLILFKTQHIQVEESIFTDSAVSLRETDLSLLKTTIEKRLRLTSDPFMIKDSRYHVVLKDLPPVKVLVHPITLDSGEIGGAIILLREERKNEFSTGDIRLLGMLAEHAAIIAINHHLYEDMKQLLFSMVQSLSDAIEAKDSYTRGHTQRVSEISVSLGKALSLSSQSLEHLRWGSVLHDVGKIGISEQILCKPAKLTTEEYDIMKKHPEIGYQIMKHILPLREALAGVLHHHERFDGKGYPKGLKGKEIPLYGRILSVADTYDSMTSTRSYRQARTHEFAINEINRVSGEQLDPEIVAVFMDMVQRNNEFLCKILKNAEKHALELSSSLPPNSP